MYNLFLQRSVLSLGHFVTSAAMIKIYVEMHADIYIDQKSSDKALPWFKETVHTIYRYFSYKVDKWNEGFSMLPIWKTSVLWDFQSDNHLFSSCRFMNSLIIFLVLLTTYMWIILKPSSPKVTLPPPCTYLTSLLGCNIETHLNWMPHIYSPHSHSPCFLSAFEFFHLLLLPTHPKPRDQLLSLSKNVLILYQSWFR